MKSSKYRVVVGCRDGHGPHSGPTTSEFSALAKAVKYALDEGGPSMSCCVVIGIEKVQHIWTAPQNSTYTESLKALLP